MDMEFMIGRVGEWKAALDRIRAAAGADNNAGISSYVRIGSEGDRLGLLAFDDIVWAETTIAGVCRGTGGCCVPLALLRVVLEAAPEGAIGVKLDDKSLTFSAPGWKRVIPARDYEQMPPFPTHPAEFKPVQAATVRTLLDSTAHAAGQDNTLSPNLACVVLKRSGEFLDAVAADNKRAARARVPYNASIPELSIHRRALREIRAAINTEDVVELGRKGNHLFLRTPSTAVAVLTVDYSPPDLSSNFGRNYPTEYLLNRTRLIHSLEGAMRLVQALEGPQNEQAGPVEVVLRCEEDYLQVSATTNDSVLSEEQIGCARIGKYAEIRVGGKFLMDAAKAIQSIDVVLRLSQSEGMVSLCAPQSDAFEAVLMAMVS